MLTAYAVCCAQYLCTQKVLQLKTQKPRTVCRAAVRQKLRPGPDYTLLIAAAMKGAASLCSGGFKLLRSTRLS